MALKIPGQQQAAASTNVAVTQGAPADFPTIHDWDYGPALPSALFVGESGTGKTDAIGRIIDAGFNVCVVDVENKLHVLRKRRPMIINICDMVGGKAPPVTVRWDRLRRFADALAGGQYREHNGKPVQIIAIDGLMEVGDIIHATAKLSFTRQHALPMWEHIGITIVDFCKTLRDAAGIAAERAGVPPIAIIATCGESLETVYGAESAEGLRFMPQLPGKKGPKALPYQFEIVWRFSAGVGDGEAHEFRIATQKGENYFAKSPAGVFDEKIVTGAGVEVDGSPHAGEMFKALVEHENSPYKD